MTESKEESRSDAPAPAEPPRFDSQDLFQGSRVVVITHAGESYRLLLTRNNRLILQK
jgi:hemin uptake protein HemP